VAFAALGLLACMLLLEACVGGRLWRRLAFSSVLVTIVCSLPFFYRLGDSAQDPMLVVRAPTVTLRSELHPSRSPIGELNAGEEVQRVDSLPGWIRVRCSDGTLGWVQSEALFSLRP